MAGLLPAVTNGHFRAHFCTIVLQLLSILCDWHLVWSLFGVLSSLFFGVPWFSKSWPIVLEKNDLWRDTIVSRMPFWECHCCQPCDRPVEPLLEFWAGVWKTPLWLHHLPEGLTYGQVAMNRWVWTQAIGSVFQTPLFLGCNPYEQPLSSLRACTGLRWLEDHDMISPELRDLLLKACVVENCHVSL